MPELRPHPDHRRRRRPRPLPAHRTRAARADAAARRRARRWAPAAANEEVVVCDLSDRAARARGHPRLRRHRAFRRASARAERRGAVRATCCRRRTTCTRARGCTARSGWSTPARSMRSAFTTSRRIPGIDARAPAGHVLRADQDLHRGSRQPLLGQVRGRERVPADLLVLSGAARPADAVVLAQLSPTWCG